MKRQLKDQQTQLEGEVRRLQEEVDQLRMNRAEQMRKVELQLENSEEERGRLGLEMRQIEEKLEKFKQLDYEEIIDKLRLELKQTKILLKDAQVRKKYFCPKLSLSCNKCFTNFHCRGSWRSEGPILARPSWCAS